MLLTALTHPRRDPAAEIDWIAANGFDAVEIVLEAPGAPLERTDWRALGDRLRAAGLPALARAAPGLPVENASPLVRQAALDELRRSLDAAHALGATLLTTRFRGWPPALADVDGYEHCRQLYSILTRHAAERGLGVALQNAPHNQHQLKHFREIMARVPDLHLALDVGHTNVGTVRPLTRDYLFALADRAAHVCLHDNDGSADQHLPFGAPRAGGIDLAAALRDLRSFRYDATITLAVYGDRRYLLLCRDLVRDLWPLAA